MDNIEQLKEYRKKLSMLSEEEKKLRDLYLKKLSEGSLQGPMTGFPSLDKPWLKYYDTNFLNIDIPEMTAYEYLHDCNKENFDVEAIEYFGTKITFREFFKKIDIAAKSYLKMGVKRGDVVSIMSVSNPELEITFYALNKIGAIINLIDVRSDYQRLSKTLNEVDSKIVLTMDNFLEVVDKAIKNTSVEKVITYSAYNSIPLLKNKLATVCDIIRKREEFTKNNQIKREDIYISWNEFLNLSKNNTKELKASGNENTIAAYVHTGGTTGVSKTVKLTNRNFNAMAVQYKMINAGYEVGDKFLNDIVPFVAYGIVDAIHMSMCLGLTNIIAPILTPKEFTNYMIKYKPNHTLTVPTYLDDFVSDARVQNMDLSFIKNLGVGGDSFDETKEKYINKFLKKHGTNAIVETGYGMTELGSGSISCTNNINKVSSLGIPLPKNNIGIFESETETELKIGQIGEICMQSPSMMQGYLNNIAEEKKVIRKHSDETTWVHSGDLGYLDEDGFLYLIGRIKRMMIHGGFKIYPNVIEETILHHSAVSQCCVIPIKSVKYGANPEAHIILKNGNYDLLKIKEEINLLCTKELPEYAIPVNYIFVNEFPLTSVGKIDFKKIETDREKQLCKKL